MAHTKRSSREESGREKNNVMKHKAILVALLCLLVSPAVARPNTEPLYHRNPLEVTEEIIPTTNTLPPIASDSDGQQTSSGENTVSTIASPTTSVLSTAAAAVAAVTQDYTSSPLFKRADMPLKTKVGTSGGYVVSTSTKILTSAGLHQSHQEVSNEGKANVIMYDNFSGHVGAAEPISEEEYQRELKKASEKVQHRVASATTPKEGLSTWVLLSGSNSPTSTESKKEIVNTTKKPYTTTTRRTATTSARKPMTTPRRRPTNNTRPASSDEKKDKINKLLTRIKVATALEASKVKPEDNSGKVELITKKPRKPTPTTTTAPVTTTSTELAITETPALTTVTIGSNLDDNGVETSTFLILEPKDAQFDLPEDRSPGKVIKKKPTRKPGVGATKKKTAIKKKKPEEKDAISGLTKLSEKKPPIKTKPMSAQIMNYLSREVMPSVGVGLVGLVITAGLASYFLGSPLSALRRSDETNRKDDVYYSNYEDYAGPDGQNEEEVFGKLIAGMPERSYYRNNIRRRTNQPTRTGHQYGNYHVQSYSANRVNPHISYRNRAAYVGTPEMYANYNRNVQAKSHNEFFYNTPPSYYTKQSSPVYVTPEMTTYTTTTTTQTPPLTSAEPVSADMSEDVSEQDNEMLPNPAAYTAEHNPEHHAQYVVGNVYPDSSMIDIITSAPVPEHGPRRRKRDIGVESGEDDFDNEIGSDEEHDSVISSKPTTTNPSTTLALDNDASTEEDKVETGNTPTAELGPITWANLIRNTVETKLAMGIHLLQHVTSQFQRYLHGVQARVENHFNRTTVHQ
ncbi:mucin-2-like [Toxorhynchites rutilus septentrionalis]|uniref:mucin-2-like n=1 Tax=Toxorhynchites rutilus septentrionalis TaxID=329112 RepID=UPI0024797D2B|nr:mucin-2-like [Toxorhynchites rutilus septentrionalis]